MKVKYPVWTLINWDGNPALNLKCWRKSFRAGHVSVGIGDFMLIAYSYGANSDSSINSTRQRDGFTITEQTAMSSIDSNQGHYGNV